MFEEALNQADPVLVEYLNTLILASIPTGLGWFGLMVRNIMKSKAARDALHSALATGVDFVTDELGEFLDDQTDRVRQMSRENMILKIRSYVRGSVPDSVKFLGASDAQIDRMAQAYLNVRTQTLNSASITERHTR